MFLTLVSTMQLPVMSLHAKVTACPEVYFKKFVVSTFLFWDIPKGGGGGGGGAMMR